MSTSSNSISTPTFSHYMRGFLERLRPARIVEVGPDAQLQLASRLAKYCNEYVAVTLPVDLSRAQFSQEMLNIKNLRLVGRNATNLSEVVPEADVVLLHNVLLDLTGTDTKLMWQYRRNELPSTPALRNELRIHFAQAALLGYDQFLAVARKGYVVNYMRQGNVEDSIAMLTEGLGVAPERITSVPLLYDDFSGQNEPWEAVIVNNGDL